jgi:acetyl esterase
MALDPDAQRLLDLVREAGRPAFETLTPAQAREAYSAGRAVLQPPPAPVALVRDLTAPGPAGPIRLRLYRGPAGEGPLPALVYMHGGGWVIGDIDSHDGVCRALALAAGCAVVSVDYRLAPEHPFPAAVDDSAAAYAWVVEQAAALGIDPARIAVGGDSAGGNLAAVLAIMGRDGTLPAPCHQLLFYPATDLAMPRYPGAREMHGFPLSDVTMRWFGAHYMRSEADRMNWRASPARASSLVGVAPAFVLTAGHDPLFDEGQAYARRLEREGVRVLYVDFADQIHGFLTMGRIIAASGTAIAMAGAALRRAFGTG